MKHFFKFYLHLLVLCVCESTKALFSFIHSNAHAHVQTHTHAHIWTKITLVNETFPLPSPLLFYKTTVGSFPIERTNFLYEIFIFRPTETKINWCHIFGIVGLILFEFELNPRWVSLTNFGEIWNRVKQKPVLRLKCWEKINAKIHLNQTNQMRVKMPNRN